MYSRILKPEAKKSFFLFGPRGTGKTTWLRRQFASATYIDLLEARLYTMLTADPQRLETLIPPKTNDWVVIDEIQRVPQLLNEVHRLIELHNIRFAMTGSSARKLRSHGVNLLAGRALTYHMYPLVAAELGDDFSVSHSLSFGHLPATFQEQNPVRYLESYIATYLQQEIEQEGLTRHLDRFTRFLETASFSQGSVLNLAQIARESSVPRKTIEHYFSILNDLMIGCKVPIFSRKAKRRLLSHEKFYFFDAGIYRAIRPRGPLDADEEVGGIGLESLIFQELRAMNDYLNLGYKLFYWRTATGREVDFVLYGSRGLVAIEVKRGKHVTAQDVRGLQAFCSDYPEAKPYLLYGGTRVIWEKRIECIPVEMFIKNVGKYIGLKNILKL